RGPEIRQLEAAFPRLTLELLPPYAPELNPVRANLDLAQMGPAVQLRSSRHPRTRREGVRGTERPSTRPSSAAELLARLGSSAAPSFNCLTTHNPPFFIATNRWSISASVMASWPAVVSRTKAAPLGVTQTMWLLMRKMFFMSGRRSR